MVWREGKDYITDWYFCMINLKGIICKSKHHVQYPDVPFAIRPIPDGPDRPFPKPDGNMEYSSDSEHSDMTVAAGDYAYKPEEDDQSLLLTQTELTTWTFQRSRLIWWVHVSKRNICLDQEQRSTPIETAREN